jgi:hypothetical protein
MENIFDQIQKIKDLSTIPTVEEDPSIISMQEKIEKDLQEIKSLQEKLFSIVDFLHKKDIYRKSTLSLFIDEIRTQALINLDKLNQFKEKIK